MDTNNLVDVNNVDYKGRSGFDNCLYGPRIAGT